MFDTTYDVLLQIESMISITLYLCTFGWIHYYGPKREGYKFYKILKCGMLIELVIPLTVGPLGGIKILFPIVGARCNGICHYIGGLMPCTYIVLTALFGIEFICCYFHFAYTTKYNIFIRHTSMYHMPIKERINYSSNAIIAPFITYAVGWLLPLNDKDYKRIYSSNLDIIHFEESQGYTLVIFDVKSWSIASIAIIIHVLLTTYTIFFGLVYYIIMEIELRECVRGAKFETAEKMRKNLRSLKWLIFLPMAFALAPFCVAAVLSYFDILPIIYHFLTANCLLIVLSYFIFSPIYTFMQVRRSPKVFNTKTLRGGKVINSSKSHVMSRVSKNINAIKENTKIV